MILIRGLLNKQSYINYGVPRHQGRSLCVDRHLLFPFSSPVDSRKMSSAEATQFLDLPGGRKIAYKKTDGHSSPTIVYAPGFMSNMHVIKALVLQKFCQENGLNYVRFDYEGVGESPGDLRKHQLHDWFEDLKCVTEKLTTGPVLLVGSSFGGWMSISVALSIPERIFGIVLIAPALNFFMEKYHLMYNNLSPKEKAVLDGGECLKVSRPYGDIYVRKDFMVESQKLNIDLSKSIPLKMPIRIIHGALDADVPYERSLKLATLFESEDVDVIIRKCGHHELSTETDLALILSTIKLLISNSNISHSNM